MSSAVLQGSLGAFKLPEVLSFLNASRKSGTLVVASGDKAVRVYFDRGALVYAVSNQPDLRLSAILLRRHQITHEQFEKIDALMRAEAGRPFGQIAMQQGLFTEPQVYELLKIQVSEILYDCFIWSSGTFAFSDNLDLPPYAVTIAVDLSNLIMEGARRIEEWEQCVRLLPDSSVVFHVISNPERGDKITLTKDEWKILFLINGQRTLEELCQHSEDEAFLVYRVVYGLLSNKLIEPLTGEVHRDDDTGVPMRSSLISGLASGTASGEATVRQAPAVFHAESTIRELPDDTSLLVSSEAKLSYRDVVAPTLAQLSILTGDTSGSVVPLVEAEYLIGRHRDNQIALNDLGVSGFHARIYRGPDGYVIEDMKSRNGTWVNGERLHQAHSLLPGDQLRLGNTELLYALLYHGGKNTAEEATILKPGSL